jgi:subtilase-type serine protease
MNTRRALTRSALLAASSVAALGMAAPAFGQGVAAGSGLSVENAPGIITNNDINPNTTGPAGGLDSGVTGVGQMIVFAQSSPTAAGLGLCTGTLINPRTVIFAAHCVNSRPMHAYGSATGTTGGVNGNFGALTSIGATSVTRAPLQTQGTPISFGFGATNRCLGITPGVNAAQNATATAGNGCPAESGAYELWRNSNFNTQTGANIYNVNQVWYDQRSLAPQSIGFLEADVALATLDTPAFDIPTWTMLFTPLTAQTHSLSIGYGINGTSNTAQNGPGCPSSANGVCGAIDYRRRAVENTLSVLGSLADRNAWLFGNAGTLEQSLYMQDFDSPAGQAAYNTATGNFDFDVFNGAALPREGTTAGGDSGSALVVDTLFDKDVMVGVLSGGSRFFGAQRFSTYGTHNFYQPLFLFWDVIVANNPYAYVEAKAGNGNWEDPNHWVQVMDPNYAIAANGQLINSLPDTPALGVSGNTVKFGEICFLDDCTDLADDDTATPLPTGNGTPVFVQGGPGTTGFVPDNVNPVNNADPSLRVQARYYDVTLAAAGTTTLSSTRTIDVLTLDGNASKLKVAAGGNLNVFGEFNQWQGWTQVDGKLTTGGDTLIGTGILSGVGTLKAPFVTVGAAVVAPGGGDKVGKLTIDGNMVMSSGSSLFIDASRNGADQLTVTGDLALNNTSVVFNKTTDSPAPRDGQSFVIARADGELLGAFGKVYTFQGVLRPSLSYNYNADTVTATLRAGSLVEILDGGSPTEIAFARALDTLRSSSYAQLWNLYGAVDWMNGAELSASLSSLAPRVLSETSVVQERQSRTMLSAVGNRISLLGTGRAEGLSFDAEGLGLVSRGVDSANSMSTRLGISSGGAQSAQALKLGGGISGFVTGSIDQSRSSYGNSRSLGEASRGWHMAMGLEMPVGSNAAVGTAVGYAEGESSPNGDRSENRTSMVAGYGAMSLGGGAYVGGLISAETARVDMRRNAHDGAATLLLTGATESQRYTASAEAGVRKAIGSGLALTPRAQLSFGQYKLGGFSETGGETALKFDDVKVTRFEGRVGAMLDGSTTVAGWTVRPQLSADYVQALGNTGTAASVRFAAAPDHAFLLPLGEGGRSWGELKGALELTKGKVSFGLSGQSAVGGTPLEDTRGALDLTIRF